MNTAVTKEPFSLAGMGEVLRETNADLASKVGVDEVDPPKIEASPDPLDHKPDDEPQGGETPAGDETPAGGDGTPTEDELQAEQQKQQQESAAAADEKKKKDEESAAADKKAKDDEAAKKAADKPADDAREKRDADLNVNLSPHTHPKTRQIITSFKENARKARDERDRIAQERDDLNKKLAEATKKAAGVALPKETEDELKTLRERVRELDITRDPQIEAKYDKPIAANNKSVIELLKGFGAHEIHGKDGAKTVDSRFETDLLRAGLSLRTLQPFIEKIEKAGFIDEAEQLREAVRENGRLTRAKQAEIESFKADYDTRVKSRTQHSQQVAEQEAKAFAEESQATLEADLAELTKTLPFLAPPPAPLPTDSEPVRKAKQAAVDEYTAASQAVEKAIASINPASVPPEKARSAAAKLNATAVQGMIFKLHVLPRLQKDLSARDARIKELEAQIGKIKGATDLSKRHASLASAPNGNAPDIPQGAPTTDAMAAFAKAAGVNVNS